MDDLGHDGVRLGVRGEVGAADFSATEPVGGAVGADVGGVGVVERLQLPLRFPGANRAWIFQVGAVVEIVSGLPSVEMVGVHSRFCVVSANPRVHCPWGPWPGFPFWGGYCPCGGWGCCGG